MAEAGTSTDQDQFSCPVCLDLLKDPVTTPCGHNFCKVCINGFWDKEDQRSVYSCPQCRETFSPRPALRRNNMLAEVVEELKKTEMSVECDSCIGRKRKALRTCLVCLASYCEDHLQPHYQSLAFKKHKLVEACAELQEKICSEHDKLMEIYCRTDQSFICYLCTMDQHKGHDTVSAKTERTEKQNELKEEQMKSQQRIQEKQKKVQELKQTVDIIKMRSQAAVGDSERIFTELISSMEKKRSEVKELIRAQEKAEVSRAERLLNQLEQEIADLKRRVTELEQFLQIHDDIHFLQSFPSLCVSPGCEDSPSFTVNQHLSFDGVRKSLSDLKERVKQICEEEFNKIRPQAAAVQMILPSELKIRKDFMLYFCYLTLDPNTEHPILILSEKNRVVTRRMTQQQYSDHPERFDSWPQVLCKESVCGRCYWEVEWNSKVFISVSYKEISRKGLGKECLFGCNSQSWSLQCSPSSVFFWHNNIKTELRGPASSRIGVYVDHRAGTLSFYSISDTMRLLHRVHTTFTQPLYAGFCLLNLDSVLRLYDPK
ncbi:E3 ubiquitin/ISG15 ligase TRIM25-like [Hemibagrus wyckioides]|uniref:E3 ubiquitin/ISG15 ligase TRIM25-like n=1 Tax=Hemibagrus wyckioides TaxID=337641 RepID=UPI00266BE0FA|nr:E3 ubiquitin/ISG15 ligase TRIM25-like [Hemibagrus wyckioides]